MGSEKEPRVQLNQSLIDGIATLQELALSEGPIGCRELARRLDMEPTRVNRLLQTLDHIGIARKTPKRKYTSGPGMHVLSAQALFASGLINKIIEPLESLRKLNMIVALGMLWRDHVSYLYHAEPGMETAEALGRLGLYPASKGGVGRVLLAGQSNRDIKLLYKNKSIDGFPEGVTGLLASLEEIRAQGYSYVETENGMHTLAVEVGEPAFCGIALSGKISLADVKKMIVPLQAVAEQIKLIPH